ncbi:MAG: sugar phosphate nucleotidyltransferase [Bacillaceae bacterium]
MSQSILGVIDATCNYESLAPISENRTLAALPMAGRYRLIDFILSNMVNSDITAVAIFPRKESRSLMDHLGSGKQWDLDRKKDGLYVFNPICGEEQFGTLQHFKENVDFVLRGKSKYVLIAPANIVSCMNFKSILKEHINAKKDITAVYSNGCPLRMYLLERKLFIDLINNAKDEDATTMADVILQNQGNLTVNNYEYEGYVSIIDSLQTYYETNLELLDSDKWKQIFMKNRPIYTKVKDEPPTRYKKETVVTNSIVANGGYLEGKIEDSVLFRAVKVGKGSTIKNSIIMQKTQIGENCVLENVILDKDVKIEDGVRLIGTKENPFVLKKGTIQGEMVSK